MDSMRVGNRLVLILWPVKEGRDLQAIGPETPVLRTLAAVADCWGGDPRIGQTGLRCNLFGM